MDTLKLCLGVMVATLFGSALVVCVCAAIWVGNFYGWWK